MVGGEVGACFHQTLGWGGRPQFGLKISGGGRAPRGPSPGSATEYSQVDNLFIFAASRVSDAISISAQTRWYYASCGGLQEPLKRLKPKLKSICMFLFNDLLLLAKKEKVWMLIDCSGWFKLVIIVISFNFFVFVLVKLIKSKSQVSWYLPRYLLRLILFNYR